MVDSGFTIRTATVADVDALTALHCASFGPADHVPVMLGKRFVRATYRWQVSSALTYVLVTESARGISGLIAVADCSFTAPMFKACLGEFVLAVLRNPLLLLKRSLWERLVRPSKMTPEGQRIANFPGMAQMTIGAVDAGHRGQGIFPALVEATRGHSRARGARAIRAGVYKVNASSSRVFTKSGWIELKVLETADTVFYVSFLDPQLPGELGMSS